MKKREQHKVVEFETVGEFLAAADTPDSQHKSSHSHRPAGDDWAGTETFEQALDLARTGWPEGAERIAKLRATLTDVVEKTVLAKSAQLHWDVAGDFLDIGRVLTGEPDSFGTFVEAESSQPSARVIKLVCNVSARAGVQAPSIFSAGAAVVAAVDVLESLGHRVELWLGSGSENFLDACKRLTVLVKIKAASQAVDLDRLAFLTASNASLRRIFFSVEEDHGFPPNSSRTCPLKVERGAVITPEVEYADQYAHQRAARVLQVCESCGISLTAEEREEIVGET